MNKLTITFFRCIKRRDYHIVKRVFTWESKYFTELEQEEKSDYLNDLNNKVRDSKFRGPVGTPPSYEGDSFDHQPSYEGDSCTRTHQPSY